MTTSASTSRSRSSWSASVGVSRKPRADGRVLGVGGEHVPGVRRAAPATPRWWPAAPRARCARSGRGRRRRPARRTGSRWPRRHRRRCRPTSSTGACDRARAAGCRPGSRACCEAIVCAPYVDDRAHRREPLGRGRLEDDGAAGRVAEQARPGRGRAGRRAARIVEPGDRLEDRARGRGWSAARRSRRACTAVDVDARGQPVLAREQLADPVVADDDEAGLDQPRRPASGRPRRRR